MRKRLSDIVPSTEAESIRRTWDSTEAAPEMGPLPAGEYRCIVESIDVHVAKSGTPGVKVAMRVHDPAAFKGRKLWADHWLTPAALPITKREIKHLGIETLDDLERPLPTDRHIIMKCCVIVRKDDDGTERNRVRSWEFDGIATPQDVEPFAPPADGEVPY